MSARRNGTQEIQANHAIKAQAKGARLVHLPSYSPDFNPIENAWSKLKALLRKVGARTLRKLQNALRWALLEITSDDAHGWFSHCGFRVPCH